MKDAALVATSRDDPSAGKRIQHLVEADTQGVRL